MSQPGDVTWSNASDLGTPHVEVKEKYSVVTPKGFTYTVCQTANAYGASTFPQMLRKPPGKRGLL